MTQIQPEETGIDPTVSVVIHGPGGIGKSTFAKDAPKTIFLDVENSTRELRGAKRFPAPKQWTWRYVTDCLDWLLVQSHDFATVAIDTVDVLEKIGFVEVVRQRPTDTSGRSVIQINSIDDYPFSRGYNYSVDLWRNDILFRLEKLRTERRMNVILISHSAPRTVDNPEGDNYEMQDLRIHKHLAGALCEWSDAVLYASLDVSVKKDNKFAKGKALGDGTRTVRTEGRPAFRAKNRYSLPFQMDLSWDTFYDYARGSKRVTPEIVAARIVAEFGSTPLAKKAASGVKKFESDTSKLLSFENWLRSQVVAEPEKEEGK